MDGAHVHPVKFRSHCTFAKAVANFTLMFTSPDVNSSIETNRTQLFATSLSQSLSVNGPFGSVHIVIAKAKVTLLTRL